jgi:hypothetical protein
LPTKDSCNGIFRVSIIIVEVAVYVAGVARRYTAPHARASNNGTKIIRYRRRKKFATKSNRSASVGDAAKSGLPVAICDGSI